MPTGREREREREFGSRRDLVGHVGLRLDRFGSIGGWGVVCYELRAGAEPGFEPGGGGKA